MSNIEYEPEPAALTGRDPNPPETLAFDHDEGCHYQHIPGFVHAVAEAFEGLLEVDLETWHRHLVLHPDAAEKRAQWIRAAGLMKILTRPPYAVDPGELAWLFETLPTISPDCPWPFGWYHELGLFSFEEVRDFYYAPGPRADCFVKGKETHGLPSKTK